VVARYDDDVDDQPRLERAPGEQDASPAGSAPGGRSVAGQLVAVIVGGALAITVLGGLLEVGIGLLAVAGAIGWLVGVALRTDEAGARRSIPVRAIALAIAAVLVGQLGLWVLGRLEGGVLDPLTYLADVFGPIVVGQLVVAAVAAAWATR
jgi:hypothetical protein